MSAKVSIVVPVYNVQQYLAKCLDSLINQTLKDIEIICVNDGSTDDSGKILEQYKKQDKRINVVVKKNGGLSSARNAGLKECKTKYVMFCDSDDYYEPEMCEKMVDAIERENSDLAACTMRVIYLAHNEMEESDQNYYRLNYTGRKTIDDLVTLKTDVSVVNKIFRTEIIKKNKIEFPEGINNEDFYFYNAYMSVSKTITFINQKLYNYMRREESIMSTNFEADKLSIDHLLVAEKLFKFYKKTGFLDTHTDMFWRQWTASFWFSMEHSSKKFRHEIRNRAKKFYNLNYKNYLPTRKDVKQEIDYIVHKNIAARIKRKVRRSLADAYKKINVGYRQRNYINKELEDLMSRNEELLDTLVSLEKEIKLDEK